MRNAAITKVRARHFDTGKVVETGPLAVDGVNHAPSNAEWIKIGREALVDAGLVNEYELDNWQFELVKE